LLAHTLQNIQMTKRRKIKIGLNLTKNRKRSFLINKKK